MYSRLLHLLVVAVSVFYVTQASWLDLNKLGIERRQLGDLVGASQTATGSSSSTPTSASSAATTSASSSSTPVETSTSSSPSSTKQAETTSSTQPSATPTAAETTSTPLAQTSSSVSQAQRTSPSRQPSPTNNDGGVRSTSSTPTPVVATSVVVVTGTNSDGSRTTMTSTSTTTSTPGLSSNESTETSGMSTKTRNTVIGVVVGVGGAIVLGALGLVAWRIWGRKKNSEESDGLMDYNMNAASMEKPEPGSSAGHSQQTPFQSTLENYHQPTAPVNASSNF